MNRLFGWFKGYNDFSKSDRSAIIVVCVLIVLAIGARIIVNNIQPKSKYNYKEYAHLLEEMEAPSENGKLIAKSLFLFDPNTISSEMLDSLDLPQFIKRNILNYRKAGGRFSSNLDVRKIYGMNDSIFRTIEDFIVIPEYKKSFAKIEESKNEINGLIDPNIADFNQLVNFGFSSFQSKNIVGYTEKGGVFKTKADLLKIYGIDSAFYYSIENHF